MYSVITPSLTAQDHSIPLTSPVAKPCICCQLGLCFNSVWIWASLGALRWWEFSVRLKAAETHCKHSAAHHLSLDTLKGHTWKDGRFQIRCFQGEQCQLSCHAEGRGSAHSQHLGLSSWQSHTRLQFHFPFVQEVIAAPVWSDLPVHGTRSQAIIHGTCSSLSISNLFIESFVMAVSRFWDPQTFI